MLCNTAQYTKVNEIGPSSRMVREAALGRRGWGTSRKSGRLHAGKSTRTHAGGDVGGGSLCLVRLPRSWAHVRTWIDRDAHACSTPRRRASPLRTPRRACTQRVSAVASSGRARTRPLEYASIELLLRRRQPEPSGRPYHDELSQRRQAPDPFHLCHIREVGR